MVDQVHTFSARRERPPLFESPVKSDLTANGQRVLRGVGLSTGGVSLNRYGHKAEDYCFHLTNFAQVIMHQLKLILGYQRDVCLGRRCKFGVVEEPETQPVILTVIIGDVLFDIGEVIGFAGRWAGIDMPSDFG
ncbi:MAG: hypothetical protein IPF76_01135 [Sphingopyxis sp.]|nr:hypothetical protein [Sphingopyxis sp.]MBK6411680.1 hypothetical protein [Sphingopyxis sp.]